LDGEADGILTVRSAHSDLASQSPDRDPNPNRDPTASPSVTKSRKWSNIFNSRSKQNLQSLHSLPSPPHPSESNGNENVEEGVTLSTASNPQFRIFRFSLSSLLRESDSVLTRALVRYFNMCHTSCEESDEITKKRVASLLRLILSLHGDPLSLLLAFLQDELKENKDLSSVMRERSHSVSILQSIWQSFDSSDIVYHLYAFIRKLSPLKMKWLTEPMSSSQSSKR
jgi:hypothetical protein